MFTEITQTQRNAEFFGAVLGCPAYAHDRMAAVQQPDKYTLGEVTLLRMLGLQAAQWLDMEREECRAYVEMRQPRVTEPWSERRYSRFACTHAEWLLAQAWGVAA